MRLLLGGGFFAVLAGFGGQEDVGREGASLEWLENSSGGLEMLLGRVESPTDPETHKMELLDLKLSVWRCASVWLSPLPGAACWALGTVPRSQVANPEGPAPGKPVARWLVRGAALPELCPGLRCGHFAGQKWCWWQRAGVLEFSDGGKGWAVVSSGGCLHQRWSVLQARGES